MRVTGINIGTNKQKYMSSRMQSKSQIPVEGRSLDTTSEYVPSRKMRSANMIRMILTSTCKITFNQKGMVCKFGESIHRAHAEYFLIVCNMIIMSVDNPNLMGIGLSVAQANG
mmetsp:Transcript_6742/g.12803  ORF Transcript_6742/g.12803 Transcript_6742/m.12803 type:complete len:113 (+) Transcript_6742:328-666(+)